MLMPMMGLFFALVVLGGLASLVVTFDPNAAAHEVSTIRLSGWVKDSTRFAGSGFLRGRDPRVTLAALAHPGLLSCRRSAARCAEHP